MSFHIESLHHVTATVDDAQEDLDFYTGLLGLRLVKKTVNFDNPSVYHFYYGDALGQPGTIMTTFPYKGQSVRVGRQGAGQVTATAFSVPTGALAFWRERLTRRGVSVREASRRFGHEVIACEDPSGLVTELVATDDGRAAWATEEVSAQHAVRGVYGVTLTVRDLDSTHTLLQEVLDLEVFGEEESCLRFGAGGGGPGQVLDVLWDPAAEAGVNGIGTVHHVALAIDTEQEQRALQHALRQRGYDVTEVKDRQYFRSIYFREPGGVLLEVATCGPGFLIDEEEGVLGHALKLPPWQEPNRAAIEAALPPVRT